VSPKTRLAAFAIALSVPATPFASHAAEGNEWEWMVEPYAWVASIGTDMRTFSPPTQADSDMSFSDIVDKLDGVFMGRVEGRNGRFGAFTDFIYLGLADSHQRPSMQTSTDLDARLFDAAFSVRIGDQRDAGLDLYGGVRYIDLDLTTRFLPDNPGLPPRTLDAGESYLDFLFGARYAWPLSDRWNLVARGDGSVGETDGTWSASLMTSLRMGNGAWLFGYRYMEADLANRNSEVALDLSGPAVGYGFRF
jgi:hypothetical protein